MMYLKTFVLHIVTLALLLPVLGCDSDHSEGAQGIDLSAGSMIYPVDFEALGLRDLISFDVYRDGDRIHAVFAAHSKEGGSAHLGYLRSEDGGEHWLQPVAITHDPALLALESRIGNDVQIAAHGDRLTAVWQITGEIPGMGPLVSASSSDGGQHWTQGVKVSAIDTDQSHADVTADAGGRFHAVWLDDRDEKGYQGLRYAQTTDDGSRWQLEQTIDDSSCSCCWNRLLAPDDRQVIALYRDMEPRDMSLASSFDNGRQWQASARVGAFDWHFDGCPHNGGALALSGDQTLNALVWTGADQRVGLYHLQSVDKGTSWSEPRRMGDATAFHSDLAARDSEHLLAVWDALTEKGAVIMISETADGGQSWSDAKVLSKPEASASFPRAMVTRYGWLILWQEQWANGPKRWVSAFIKNN